MTTTLQRINDERAAGALALLLVAVAAALANFVASGENGGVGPYAISLAAAAIVVAILFGRVLPSVENHARSAWILAILALVTVVVFWSGLPFVFGMAALVAAARGARTAPAVLAGLAMAATLAACILG